MRGVLSVVFALIAPAFGGGGTARALDMLSGAIPDRVLPVGTAVPAPEGGIELTADALWQAGGVFWGCPLVIGPDAAFALTASVAITGEMGTGGADGVAVVLHAHPKGPLGLGKVGGELGFGGLAPGLAAELDTFRNATDSNDNHIAWVTTGGSVKHLAVSTPPFDLNDGRRLSLTVVYGAGSLSLTVRDADGVESTTAFPGDPASVLGDRAYIGIVAGTGAKKNRHVLLDWRLDIGGQPDTDHDGAPDACDADDDGDGVPDTEDVCPAVADSDQADADHDRIGDACDSDSGDGATSDADQDGLPNASEAGITDANNPDTDGDLILDGDEATADAFPDQDGDGFVDALDADTDGDGVLDLNEAGDLDLSTAPIDSEGDGAADFRDPDSDNDGVQDLRDTCRTLSNSDQADSDQNGVGDACEGANAPAGAQGAAVPPVAGQAAREASAGHRPARPQPTRGATEGGGFAPVRSHERPPPPPARTGASTVDRGEAPARPNGDLRGTARPQPGNAEAVSREDSPESEPQGVAKRDQEKAPDRPARGASRERKGQPARGDAEAHRTIRDRPDVDSREEDEDEDATTPWLVGAALVLVGGLVLLRRYLAS